MKIYEAIMLLLLISSYFVEIQSLTCYQTIEYHPEHFEEKICNNKEKYCSNLKMTNIKGSIKSCATHCKEKTMKMMKGDEKVVLVCCEKDLCNKTLLQKSNHISLCIGILFLKYIY